MQVNKRDLFQYSEKAFYSDFTSLLGCIWNQSTKEERNFWKSVDRERNDARVRKFPIAKIGLLQALRGEMKFGISNSSLKEKVEAFLEKWTIERVAGLRELSQTLDRNSNHPKNRFSSGLYLSFNQKTLFGSWLYKQAMKRAVFAESPAFSQIPRENEQSRQR